MDDKTSPSPSPPQPLPQPLPLTLLSPPPPYEGPDYIRQRSSSLTHHTINLKINLYNRRRSTGNTFSYQAGIKDDQIRSSNNQTIVKIPQEVSSNSYLNINQKAIRPHRRQSYGKFSIDEATIQSPWKAFKQLIIPFLLAGLGNVSAGVVLDYVQHWPSFTDIRQFLILIPALLGLKGNVEMTLASRLSTHANLGNLNAFSDIKELVVGNMALVQCQASTVGIIAPIVTILLSLMSSATRLSNVESEITFTNIILVMSSSVIKRIWLIYF